MSASLAAASNWHALSRATRWRRLAIISLAAAALAVYFFCPKFVLWRGIMIPDLPGIGVPPGAQTAEVRRAHSSLLQLNDPFAVVSDPIGRPIAWRLLFPLIWHYLPLPPWLFLAMPFVGCCLALWMIADLTAWHTGSQAAGFWTAIAMAACPWFFVSTGWLAYFDSWLIVGLLLVSFGRNRIPFTIACLLTPWIDERLLLGLPLCLLVRAVDQTAPGWPGKKWLVDAAIAIVSALVYLGLRWLLAQRGTGETDAYVADHFSWARLAGYSPLRCWEGLWMSLRAGWVFVGVLFWFLWRSHRRPLAGALLATLLVTLGVGMIIASDIHRTFEVVIPLALSGVFVSPQCAPRVFRFGLPAAAIANLLLPGAHVFTTDREPILYLYAEIERWSNPPAEVDPRTFVNLAAAYANQQKLAEAETCLDAAIALDSAYCPARVQRIIFYLNSGRVQQAEADAAEGLRRCPREPELYFLRGVMRLRSNDAVAGAADLQRSLSLAPPDWPRRQEALKMLEQGKSLQE